MTDTLKRAADMLRHMSDAGSTDEYRSCNDIASELEAMAGHTTPRTCPGWQIVPTEPTDEMVEAAWDSDAADYVGEHKRIYNMFLAYKVMLAAAPKEPK